MKSLAVIICGLCFVPDSSGAAEPCGNPPATWAPWWRREDREIEITEATIRYSASLPKERRLDALLRCLTEIGDLRQNPWHRDGIDDTFLIVQRTVLGIPGHGRHCAILIEKKRAAYLKQRGVNQAYDTYNYHLAEILIGMLGNLPSPESVWILGEYLQDERDPPPEEQRKWWCIEVGTPVSAAFGLAEVELRGYPFPRPIGGSYELRPTAVPAARAWYEEIKSGKRAFSFKGQSVEYRFKPDGTWVSTPIANPPDDAPVPPPAKVRRSTPAQASSAPPAAAPVSRSLWLYVIGSIALAVAVLFAVAFRDRSADTDP